MSSGNLAIYSSMVVGADFDFICARVAGVIDERIAFYAWGRQEGTWIGPLTGFACLADRTGVELCRPSLNCGDGSLNMILTRSPAQDKVLGSTVDVLLLRELASLCFLSAFLGPSPHN